MKKENHLAFLYLRRVFNNILRQISLFLDLFPRLFSFYKVNYFTKNKFRLLLNTPLNARKRLYAELFLFRGKIILTIRNRSDIMESAEIAAIRRKINDEFFNMSIM